MPATYRANKSDNTMSSHSLQECTSAEDRLRCLQTVTSCLALARTSEEVADVVIEHVLPALGASEGTFTVVSEDGTELLTVRMVGYSPETMDVWGRYPVSAPVPIADSIRTREPIVITSQEDKIARYPALKDVHSYSGGPVVVVLPMLLEERTLGAIELTFAHPPSFTSDELVFKQTISQLCAAALERARLFEQERKARQEAEAERELLNAAMQAHAASEQSYKFLSEAIPEILFTTDGDGNCDYCNSKWYAYTGLTTEQSMGAGWASTLHPEDMERIMAWWADNYRQRSEAETECRYRAADGTYRWFLARVVPQKDDDGNVVKWIGISTDIDALKSAERRRQESEERFHAFMNNSPFAAWISDDAGNLIYVNEPYARFLDATVGDLQGKTAFDLFPAKRAQEYITNNRHVLSTGQVLETLEPGVKPDGTIVEAIVYKFPIRDISGRPLVGGIAIDITERRKLEAQLLQSQKMEGIGRLAGGVAHDFNNLLSVVLGYAELLEIEVGEGSSLLSSVQNIQIAATRAAKLTQQLLAFARRQVTEPKVIHPNKLLTDMMQMLDPLIGEHIELKTRLEETAGHIRIDPHQLEQVIVNLVVNARDAMPNGGTLVLQTRNVRHDDISGQDQFYIMPGSYLCISVSDTGAGMTEEVKAQAFEPFFSTKEVGKGTGLGLATCYGIIKQNEGYIGIDSEIGVGTTVSVYLPLVEAAEAEAANDRPPFTPMQGIETVLLVEDEPMVRELAVQTLLKSGYTVLVAEHGKDALQVVMKHSAPIHLLITDVIMPQMGGLELAEQMLRLYPNMRVLYVSGYTQEAFSTLETLPHHSAFLQKPFAAVDLLTKVREVLMAHGDS